ncbi:CapA family protein [Calderihabitans maritimus]|uniref:Capsule synthesis protein, CapA n=1 Tax=Calderihabitans maritimus TaxID=1246530 RepID=A0A1Z5HSB0_9FIRM|nr:CapA family protein [Calderihabitans maritimus]GAW92404.1 capsule synthesis protein, CapA [Calderihabitans maritimus]
MRITGWLEPVKKELALSILVALLAVSSLSFTLYQVLVHTFREQSLLAVAEPGSGDAAVSTVPETVQLLAVGDVMLARKVGRLMEEKGLYYPFAKIAARLQSADLTFGNLESPISDRGFPLPRKGIWFRARPETVRALVYSGFDVMSLANNHALDYESPALLQTIEILARNGIASVGAGENLMQARKSVVKTVNGVRVGFLAYSDMADLIWDWNYPRSMRATEERPGIAPLDEKIILEDIAELRKKVDIVVVSLHWGEEYSDYPTAGQRRLARRLIDAGAHLIIGHHPHTLQGLEVYRHGLIAYSLGNFVFDQNWSLETRQGLILDLVLTPLGIREARIMPIFIHQSQPRIASGEQGQAILEKTVRLSRQLGTRLILQENEAVISGEPTVLAEE